MTKAPTILVVDDDEPLRESICLTLEDAGYATLSAADGREALACVRDPGRRPDLVLLDLMMPVMNGWQFREAQRKDASASSIPVVVITANGAASAESVEADGLLLKPFNLDDLLGVVRKFCQTP